jgi:molybdopterin biosynthesis enzyme
MRVTADDVKAPSSRLREEGYARCAMLVAQGTRITPQEQALLTAAGVLTVPVYRRPRVGVVLSGYDVAPPAEVEHAWQRPDSMSAYVRSLLARWGYVTPPVERLTPIRLITSPDAIRKADMAHVERVRDLMSRYDLLISVGMPSDPWLLSSGSRGPFSCCPWGQERVHFDNTTERAFMCGLGDDRTPPIVVNHRRYRPGSLSHYAGQDHLSYYDRTIVLTVPGHTSEVAAVTHVFARRILDSMEGLALPGPVWRMGTLESPITRHPLEHRFLWGMAHNDETGHVSIRVSDDQNSLSLNTFATSNALVTIRSGGGQVSAGERIDYLPFE